MRTVRLSPLFLTEFFVGSVHAVALADVRDGASRDLSPSDAYTLILCQEGALLVETDADTLTLSGGEALLLPTTPVHLQYEADTRLELMRFTLISADGDALTLSDGLLRLRACEELSRDIDALCTLYQSGGSLSQLAQVASTVLSRLSRDAMAKQGCDGILPALDYIHDHLCEDVRVDTLAALCGMCESSLRREFSRALGISPKAYILQKKLTLSSRMLTSGLYSIKEICEMLGFYDDAYFSKLFKRHSGLAPMQYAKEHAGV